MSTIHEIRKEAFRPGATAQEIIGWFGSQEALAEHLQKKFGRADIAPAVWEILHDEKQRHEKRQLRNEK